MLGQIMSVQQLYYVSVFYQSGKTIHYPVYTIHTLFAGSVSPTLASGILFSFAVMWRKTVCPKPAIPSGEHMLGSTRAYGCQVKYIYCRVLLELLDIGLFESRIDLDINSMYRYPNLEPIARGIKVRSLFSCSTVVEHHTTLVLHLPTGDNGPPTL